MNNSAFMENLRRLFAECDSNNTGSLGQEEFSELCNKIGLNREAASETFKRLDIDQDGRITFDEFAVSFNQYSSRQASGDKSTGTNQTTPRVTTTSPQPGSRPATNHQVATTSGAPKSARSPTQERTQRLSPSPKSSIARKSASPLGVMSLGSTGSSGSNFNLISGGRSTSTGADGSDFNEYALDDSGKDSMVVYSSDAIGNDFDQGASGSGQFNSMLSSSSSFSQVRNMQDLLDCVQKLQSENQILSQIFFKDKREREEYISQLGEEFDLQVREVEERANKRAREELEAEKKRLREMMQSERETLQHHYQTIEKMSKLIKSPNLKTDENDSIDKVKSKLEDTYLENRQLKKSLLDTKSDVALIWKEMEKLKSQYEVKLSSAYERNNETRTECDHIKQQLTLMKDSNRKLQDASDVITNYITDKVEPVIKSATNNEDDSNYLNPSGSGSLNGSNRLGLASQSNSRKGSLLSEYLNNDDQSFSISAEAQSGSNNSGDIESLGSSHYRAPPTTKPTQDRFPKVGDIESNRSLQLLQQISRDEVLKKSSSYAQEVGVKTSGDDEQARLCNSVTSNSINEVKSPNQEEKTGQTKTIEQSTARSGFRNIGRHFFIGSRAQSDAKLNEPKEVKSITQDASQTAQSLDIVDEPSVEPADGPSAATYNIILVGDSFVGKSSFAARFMEGSFIQGIISNCSIDFKTKSYKVDGVNYTVNLWDTAGQERFRSITASYFRKADGIILMYDVTERRSYLNVRNWMSTISDTASENVAVLLVGNKIDLRNKNNEDKCVPLQEGLRLAREYDIVFLETSVKTGANLIPSMGRLIRYVIFIHFTDFNHHVEVELKQLCKHGDAPLEI